MRKNYLLCGSLAVAAAILLCSCENITGGIVGKACSSTSIIKCPQALQKHETEDYKTTSSGDTYNALHNLPFSLIAQ